MSAVVTPSGECLRGEGLVWLIGTLVCSLAAAAGPIVRYRVQWTAALALKRHWLLPINHGRRSRGDRGDTSPPEFGVGDDNANCPPQILSYKYKMSVLWPSKYTKIRFRPGLPCRPPSRLKRRHVPFPIPYPTWHQSTFGHRHAFPQNSSQIYAYAINSHFRTL